MSSIHKPSYRESLFLQSKQDGLFFGLEFLKNFLSSEEASEEIQMKAYIQDGTCILKGQTLLSLSLKNNLFKKKNELLSAISYLSGAYTLVSCFTERQWDFSISAYPSENCDLVYWEKQALLKAGALVQKTPKKIYNSQKNALEALNKEDKNIVLNGLNIESDEIKHILKKASHKKISLYGSFFPEDLETFREDPIETIYPICLQGFFPTLKMKLQNDKKF